MERWIVFYSLLLTQNFGEMDSILFIIVDTGVGCVDWV